MKMKSYFSLIVFAIFILLLNACSSSSGTKDALSFGAPSLGSSSNIMATGMSDIIQKHTDMSSSVVTTAGPDAMLQAIDEGRMDLAMVDTVSLPKAYAGTDPFEKALDVRLMLLGDHAGNYFIARADAGIETPADLKGKRLVGKRPAAVRINELTAAMLDVYGFTEDDVTVIETVDTQEALQALTQGTVDAVILPGGMGAANIQELAQTLDIVFPTVDKWDEIIENENLTPGSFIAVNPAGTFPGHDEVPFLSFNTAIAASPELSEETVYTVTKTLLENTEEIKAIHAVGAYWTLENTIENKNFAVPYHDGAIKYFKEMGVWTEEHEARQNELLAK